jgi:hypothetical protein
MFTFERASRRVIRRVLGASALIALVTSASCNTAQKVSVNLNPNAAQTVGQGQIVAITAAVANDSSNAGVTWTLTGAGALSLQTTTSVTYTAPAVINSASVVTVTATSVKDTTKTTILTINLAPISITLTPTSPALVDQGKQVVIAATLGFDTNSQGVTWTLTGAGTLTGSTTSGTTYNAPASVTSVTVKATAAGNTAITQQLTINVAATPAITTTSLPNASIAVPYGPTALAETGGVAPFVWSNPNGDLPTWLTLNSSTGAVSGTPAQTGTFSFTAQMTDAMGLVSPQQVISLTVGVAAVNACGPTLGHEGDMKGEYALYVAGYEGTAGTPIALAASFSADGTGKVTAGEEDFTKSGVPSSHVALTAASSYVVGLDDRGCVSLVDANGTKTFRFALNAPVAPAVATKGRIIEFDDPSTTGTGRRASGIIRLQTTTDFVAGNLKPNYAFGMDGLDMAGGHYVVGGSFTLNHNTGAIASVFSDIDDAGVTTSALAGGSGSLTLGSLSATTGRVPGSLALDAVLGHTYALAIYIINANEFFAITTDTLSATQPILSGRFIVTGSAFTDASAAGSDMIHINGTTAPVGLTPPSPTGTIGILTFATGAPNTVKGTLYSYSSGAIKTPQAIAGNYTVNASSGRVALTNSGTNPPAVYLTTPTDGISAFIIGLNSGVGSDAFFGYATPQNAPPVGGFTGASLTGTYAFGIDQMIDNGVSNDSGVEAIASGGITSGIVDFSSQGGLTINFGFKDPMGSHSFTIAADGSGKWSGFGSLTTYVVTDGTKVFILDDTSTLAEIIVLEQ